MINFFKKLLSPCRYKVVKINDSYAIQRTFFWGKAMTEYLDERGHYWWDRESCMFEYCLLPTEESAILLWNERIENNLEEVYNPNAS